MVTILVMDSHALTQVQPSQPAKRQRKSDYEEMRDLTEQYIRKVRKTLETERCDHAGVLQNSLQRYFSSEQFTRNHSDSVSRTSVLAFIMHAAEVAVSQRPAPPDPPLPPQPVVEPPKKIEAASQTVGVRTETASQTVEEKAAEPIFETVKEPPKEHPTKEVPKELPKELPRDLLKEPPKEAPKELPKDPVPTERPAVEPPPKPKIFTTIVGRTESTTTVGRKEGSTTVGSKQIKPKGQKSAPPPPVKPPVRPQPIPVAPPQNEYYTPMPERVCEICRERFWTDNDLQSHHFQEHLPGNPIPDVSNYETANVPCPIDGCGEQFEDNNELLLHMRTFHTS